MKHNSKVVKPLEQKLLKLELKDKKVTKVYESNNIYSTAAETTAATRALSNDGIVCKCFVFVCGCDVTYLFVTSQRACATRYYRRVVNFALSRNCRAFFAGIFRSFLKLLLTTGGVMCDDHHHHHHHHHHHQHHHHHHHQ